MAERKISGSRGQPDRKNVGDHPHQGSTPSNTVQTFLAIGVQLDRRQGHWRWKSSDEIVGRSTTWTLTLDPEIKRWIKSRKIEHRATRIKIYSERHKRAVWQVFFQFKNIKHARYFAAVWRTESIDVDALRFQSGAGNMRTME